MAAHLSTDASVLTSPLPAWERPWGSMRSSPDNLTRRRWPQRLDALGAPLGVNLLSACSITESPRLKQKASPCTDDLAGDAVSHERTNPVLSSYEFPPAPSRNSLIAANTSRIWAIGHVAHVRDAEGPAFEVAIAVGDGRAAAS